MNSLSSLDRTFQKYGRGECSPTVFQRLVPAPPSETGKVNMPLFQRYSWNPRSHANKNWRRWGHVCVLGNAGFWFLYELELYRCWTRRIWGWCGCWDLQSTMHCMTDLVLGSRTVQIKGVWLVLFGGDVSGMGLGGWIWFLGWVDCPLGMHWGWLCWIWLLGSDLDAVVMLLARCPGVVLMKDFVL